MNLPPNYSTRAAASESFIPIIRELIRTYQAFEHYGDRHIRELGLTIPQFDVIATLGNTDGMTMTELAQKTLVTKGTLTGIVDRLEQKGLVKREVPPDNRRCFQVVLTNDGDTLFQKIFPAHIAYLKERFQLLTPDELQETVRVLQRLRNIF